MEIKCKTNPYYHKSKPMTGSMHRLKNSTVPVPIVWDSADIFVKRPDATKSASGLLSFKEKVIKPIVKFAKEYRENIRHTYDHKVVYALVEKELFGRNTINSVTHDADKMIMYMLGFPKKVVGKIHRAHSEHHIESGKHMNLKSMLCDMVASSPDYKPEKKYSLREFFNRSEELQNLKGFKELLEKYNFGENIDSKKIKMIKNLKYSGAKGLKAFLF